ncbi:ATP-binding cassette domain-containing protein [Pseudomonas sp. R5(2019)]|uniref:ATP-binding cassette domain-containing protein n=1 Tax=Pseudomonas sp. R5(2019) TaxID=2697566 RepID=UPI0014136B16|nr:ATP-binding cassette domain-containing protein [Pseudomonas sp. R5(2019)]NBA97710.1 ATP-binding cassette domain-containing protein [Pseudomonas sp. R5(2019)]
MKDFIKKSISDHPLLFTGTFIAVIVLKVSILVPAFILGAIIDNLAVDQGARDNLIIYLLAGYAGVTLMQAFINPLQTYCLTRLVQQTVKERSVEWTAAILAKEFEHFSSMSIGQLIKSTDRGITAHEKILSFFVTAGLPLLIEIAIVTLLFIHFGGVTLFALLLIASAVYLLCCHRLILWRTQHINAVNDSEDQVSGLLFSTLRAASSIKLEGVEDHALKPLDTAFERYARAATTVASSAAALGSAKILFVGLSTCGLLIWGVQGQQAPEPAITIGALVAISSIAAGFLTNISGLAEAYRSAHQFLADKVKLQQTLDLPNFECAGRTVDPPLRSRSSLKLSSCAVPGRQLTMDQPLSFYSDQSVAITGPSGGGKSTLLELLAGIQRDYRQYLNLDGIRVEDIRGSSQLRALRYCPQSPSFLPGDMNSGVIYGHPIDPHLWVKTKSLLLGSLIDHLDLNEGATNISGGQAKRLSLLRLINRPGTFNFFDEPTASLDRELSIAVWNTLFEVFCHRGLVCVTHDVEALRLFDRVIVLEEGRIVADGPWEVLKSRDDLQHVLADAGGRRSR